MGRMRKGQGKTERDTVPTVLTDTVSVLVLGKTSWNIFSMCLNGDH